MAAPTTISTGLDYVLSLGGTTIGGGTNATITQSQEIISTTNKSSSVFAAGLSGLRTWQMGFEGMYLVTNEVAGTTLGVSAAGTALKGIKTVSLSLDSDLLDSSSSSSTNALDREIVPSTRKATITVTGELFDFDFDASPTQGDEGLEDIVDAIDGTVSTSIAIVFSFGSAQTITMTMRPTNFSFGTPHDGIMEYTVSLESVANISSGLITTGADAGIILIFADFFASGGATEVGTALLSTGVVDQMEFTGAAYPENLTIDVDWTGVVTLSGTLQGSGKLTKQKKA